MTTIWKYELRLTDTQVVMMPKDAEILSVANQNGFLCVWAKCIPTMPKQERRIEIIGTGNPIPSEDTEGNSIIRRFIGSVVSNPFVWHVFERLQL